MGPPKYCVEGNSLPGFSSKMLLLLNYLIHVKVCKYPLHFSLTGSIEQPRWRRLGQELSTRGISYSEIDEPGT